MRTEQEYQALADWAEHEMDLTQATGGVTQYGADAAAQGRADLEAAAGGPEQLAELMRGGRPSIDPDAAPGEHAKNRQVRLPAATNRALVELAAAQGRTPSDLMREAISDYLTARAS